MPLYLDQEGFNGFKASTGSCTALNIAPLKLQPVIWSADQEVECLQNHWPLKHTFDPPLCVLVDLKAAGAELGAERLLSVAEQERWRSFKQASDRERYLVRTVSLRTLLGRLLDCEASAIAFNTGSHGKPELSGGQRLHFNISHSGDWLLMAFHPSQAVGVDVQRIDTGMNWRPIAERCFARPIINKILEQPERNRQQHFIQAWCELEARLKCRGIGLSGLGELESSSTAEEERLWLVSAPEGYQAAIAQATQPLSGQTGRPPARGKA